MYEQHARHQLRAERSNLELKGIESHSDEWISPHKSENWNIVFGKIFGFWSIDRSLILKITHSALSRHT